MISATKWKYYIQFFNFTFWLLCVPQYLQYKNLFGVFIIKIQYYIVKLALFDERTIIEGHLNETESDFTMVREHYHRTAVSNQY